MLNNIFQRYKLQLALTWDIICCGEEIQTKSHYFLFFRIPSKLDMKKSKLQQSREELERSSFLSGENDYIDSLYEDLFKFSILENPSLLQFLHRTTAYAIFFIFILITILIFKNKNLIYLRRSSMTVFFFLIFQIFLGVLTVLSGAEILIASMHQIGSIILVSSTLILVFESSKIN